uniref:F-box domain-containing protein n=1 Tax=Oreochromis aureus TaxID=47969 RepID=A0A668U276_OREAU
MAEKIQQLESVVIRSLRRFRDRYFPDKVVEADLAVGDSGKEEQQYGLLDTLPVDVQFLIMTFLSPADLCHLGATSRYWSAMVRDPLLWRYFLLRDMPYWPSIDHVTIPHPDLLDAPLISEDESLDDREEGNEGIKLKFDYMSEYLKGCPSSRQQWLPSRPAYEVVTSFFQSLVPASEPRYAMFGPGMEQLDVSLVTRLMHAPDILPVSGTPHRQINGQREKEPECNRRASAINSLPLKEMTTQGTQCVFLLLRFSRCAKWWMGSSMLPMQNLGEVVRSLRESRFELC